MPRPVYWRYFRIGRVGEISLIGFVLLMSAILGGQYVQETPALAALFTFTGTELSWMLSGARCFGIRKSASIQDHLRASSPMILNRRTAPGLPGAVYCLLFARTTP